VIPLGENEVPASTHIDISAELALGLGNSQILPFPFHSNLLYEFSLIITNCTLTSKNCCCYWYDYYYIYYYNYLTAKKNPLVVSSGYPSPAPEGALPRRGGMTENVGRGQKK
jgi:hypothetical protein